MARHGLWQAAMSSDPEAARGSASAWFLERSYSSFEEMAVAEAAKEDGIDFIIIATPNNLHYPVRQGISSRGHPRHLR